MIMIIFILMQITLTISSGLPPLLTGESFLCLLATDSGVTISVPYSKVNQTTFKSNITGAISQLNVAKLGMWGHRAVCK